MEEPFRKIINSNSNSNLNRKKTLFSTREKVSPLSAVSNNKKYFPFKSMSKIYINSIIKNSQIDSSNEKKRIAKTPNNYNNYLNRRFDKKQIVKRAKTFQTLKKCYSKITNESYEKSELYCGQKIDLDLININISILASYFKSIYPDQIRIKKFNEEYKDKNIEGYEEILLLMKEFKDFNIFDYLSVSSGNTILMSKEKQEERIKNICKRNNIILSLLIEYEYLKEKEDKGIISYKKNTKIFNSDEFLLPLLENFKNIIIHLNDNEISFEVEVLIIALLDLNEYAEFIYQSHIRYFNEFLNKIGLKNYNFTKFLQLINEQDYDYLNKDEILIFRKTINSMAERDFFLGLDKIITNEKLCKFSSEGRLWKTIGNTLEPYDIYKLWEEYEKQVDLGNIYIINKKTIDIEYSQEIKNIKEQIKQFDKVPLQKKDNYETYKSLTYKLISLQKEMSLPFISDIEDLFLIFFKYNLKNVVMHFLDNIKELSVNIFEICLAFDEDICINILERCIKASNVNPSYVHLCISKKYFRLTRMLSKFPLCKNELIKFYDRSIFQSHIGKKKNSVYFQYKEGKEDVLHFLNEKGTTYFDNSVLTIKNTMGMKNAHTIRSYNLSKTIINPLEYMKKIFRKILPKKNKLKKRNSICTPNIHNIKIKNNFFTPMLIKKNLDSISEINKKKRPLKTIDNISNASSSHLQSSTNTLMLNNNQKKNSFFSMLNNDVRKENFFSSHNLNTPISNFYVDNIILEENPETPQEKNQETVNRISKFMKINGYNFRRNQNFNDNLGNLREIEESDLEKEKNKKKEIKIYENKNKSLKPRNRVKNLSIECKLFESNIKSFNEDSDEIIKKLKNQIKKNFIKNGNNKISIKDDNEENGEKDDSPILKIIYNTDGEECDSNRLIIRNKTLFGMIKSARKSKSISQFSKKESSSKEKDSLKLKQVEKNRLTSEKNFILNDVKFNKYTQKTLNTNILFNNTKIKDKLENKKTKSNEFSIFDPISQKLLEGKIKINIQFVLIENLRFGQYLFDIISLLGLMPLREFTIEMCEKICLNLNSYNTNEESIISCSSPLLSLALAAELLNKLGNISTKMKYNAESVSKSLLFLAYNIQTSIANEDTLNYYLRAQTDLSGRSALEIYAENKFYNILEDPNVGLIIGKIWYGSEHEHKISTFLRMTRILKSNSGEMYEHLINKDYLPHNSRYSFQFYQYVNNCSERNYYESVSTIIITLLYQVVVFLYVTFTKDNPFHPKTHYYYIIQLITNTLMLLTILNDIFCLIFFRLTGRKVKFEIMQMLIDCFLFIFLIFNVFDVPQKLYPVEEFTDLNILLDGIIYSTLLFLAWMKVLFILRITKLYGSFISIMINIFWHVFNFFIVVICITLLFAQCFCLYFKDSNENYKLIYDSFLTLFNTAWGQVEFRFIELDIFGEISLILFTTLSNIMLFNLIVGIVDNLFDEYHEKSEAESRAKLILTHERKKWDKSYGLLILFPSPFNIFAIFLFPILIFSGENNKKFNILFSKFCYFFIALIIFIYMIILGVLTYLLALFKSLILSSYETLTSTNKIILKNKYKIIFFSFLKRPIELIIYFFEDCILFWKLVFIEPKIDEEKKKQELTTFRRYIITLRKLFNDHKYKEHQTKLTVRDISRKFSLFKKKNTFHFTRMDTSSPKDTEALEEDKEWQKMITHTLFLQLNGQKKRKGQSYSENISLTDGLSDTKTIQISTYKHNKKNSRRENLGKRSDILNPVISQGSKIHPKKMISINVNNSENDDIHYLSNMSKDNTMILQKKLNSIEVAKMQMSLHLIKNLWKFIDKFVDPEGIIDIDRALNLLPDRATYDNDFILNLEYFNIRTFMRGIRKYYFSLEKDNPFYSFTKGNLMVYRLMIKIKMIYSFLSEKAFKKIKSDFDNLNDMNKFAKTAEAFQKYEEKDIMSDYDDEGKYAANNRYDSMSLLNTSKVVGDSESERSPHKNSLVESNVE